MAEKSRGLFFNSLFKSFSLGKRISGERIAEEGEGEARKKGGKWAKLLIWGSEKKLGVP